MSWVSKYNARCFWGQNSYDQCDDFDLYVLKKSLGWKQKKASLKQNWLGVLSLYHRSFEDLAKIHKN